MQLLFILMLNYIILFGYLHNKTYICGNMLKTTLQEDNYKDVLTIAILLKCLAIR